MSALKAAYGLSRFAIARRILAGESLADAALAAGFSDQSHMTRHFLRAFGMTPGRWQALRERR
ncbi:helix-turn-helix domain-containing protein [Roseospira goensis]|nr:helix-turn-helix domain-containing protein [Roseospira goensis]